MIFYDLKWLVDAMVSHLRRWGVKQDPIWNFCFLLENFSILAKTGIQFTMRVWLQMQHVPTSSLESDGMVRKLLRFDTNNIFSYFQNKTHIGEFRPFWHLKY